MMPPPVDELLQRALGHHAKGQLQQAHDLYQEILGADPENPQALHLLGVVAHQMGRDDLALEMIRLALAFKPDYAEAYNNLGSIQCRSGNWHAARASLQSALAIQPSYPEALNNLGNVFKGLQQWDEAVASYHRALALRPDYAEAWSNLGMACWHQGRLDEAVEHLHKGVELAPERFEYHLNLGNILRSCKRWDQAVASYRLAVRLQPASAEALVNLGNALVEIGRADEGVTHLCRGLERNDSLAEGHFNLGNAYHQLLQPRNAVIAYQKALDLQPDFPDASYNKAMSHLLAGDLQEGWHLYEWRWQTEGFLPHNRPEPPWHGTELAGKTLLIHCEQGFGDSIQFIRLVPFIQAFGGRVVLLCPPALTRLFATVRGIDHLVDDPSQLPACDCQIPLLSLPNVLGTTLETIPSAIPYLTVDPELKDCCQQQFRDLSGIRVGVVWHGDARHGNDRNRSTTANTMARLQRRTNHSLISLQKDARPEELAHWPGPIRHSGEWLVDFAHTAAVIANLDLVVGVDTAVIHLAGALGCPTWVLLPRVPDWRWLLDRTDSPWYPGMRLFRQKVPGEWNGVMDEIGRALQSAGLSRQDNR
ncbi:MAG: tetratricopeptide repeat protein [Magnetococcales bacterium]|nr:tetratricopeptide repeat protein [Magnetococcales bacterium]